MTISTVAKFDAYQTLGFAAISGVFAAVGTPFLHQTRICVIINNTDGDMIFSTDGETPQIFVPSYTIRVYDLTTNKQTNSPQWVLPANTQFYVMQSTAPSKGAVYIESVYGQGE